jgi:membrane protease YdiL (CAAX protease family)
VTTKLALAVLIEIAYALITRAFLPVHASGIELELLVTGFRAAAVAAFWLLFHELIMSRVPNVTGTLHPALIGVVILVPLEPVLAGNYGLGSVATKAVFAFTSIVVAIHEEFVYRGVLQNLLERRSGRFTAVVISNVVFTLYHYGAQPFVPWNLVSLFAVGCIFGLMYSITGSLLFVIALHAIDDALWAFSPFLTPPWPQMEGAVLTALALVVCTGWASLRSNNGLHGDASVAAKARLPRAPERER